MKCVAKNSYFIVVHDVCSTRKHQEYSTSTGFQGWVKRRRPVWINGSHLERLCQAPPPPWCPGESEDLLIWLKKCTNGPLHKIQKVKTIWRRNVQFTLRNPMGEGLRSRGSDAGICRICFGTLSLDFEDISIMYLNVQVYEFVFVWLKYIHRTNF